MKTLKVGVSELEKYGYPPGKPCSVACVYHNIDVPLCDGGMQDHCNNDVFLKAQVGLFSVGDVVYFIKDCVPTNRSVEYGTAYKIAAFNMFNNAVLEGLEDRGGFNLGRLCHSYSDLVEDEHLQDRDEKYVPVPEPKSMKKYDQGKCMPGQTFEDFPLALLGVAEVSRYGVEKYQSPGSWKYVEDGLKRYKDALGRHLLQANVEGYDGESGYMHWLHVAWNALAVSQFYLDSGMYPRDISKAPDLPEGMSKVEPSWYKDPIRRRE